MALATGSIIPIDWVQSGAPDMPCVLAFTGFGHRMDPWQRLRPEGWRLGVIRFPVGLDSRYPVDPSVLAEAVEQAWSGSSARVAMAFSFGGAALAQLGQVWSDATFSGSRPDMVHYVAPVQWARAPWSTLRRIPRRHRLRILRSVARYGPGLVAPFLPAPQRAAAGQFAQMVERYVGWDFVDFYLPYLDWIDSTAETVRQWNAQTWPITLIGAKSDQVIPAVGMPELLARAAPGIRYQEVEASHFNALDAARPFLLKDLESLVLQKR